MGINESQVKSLYLRLPSKIKEELQIKQLHPDIIRVKIPRQKSARWCHVEFESAETCLNALKEIRKTKIDGKSVICKLARKPSKIVSVTNQPIKEEKLEETSETISN